MFFFEKDYNVFTQTVSELAKLVLYYLWNSEVTMLSCHTVLKNKYYVLNCMNCIE